MTFEVKQIMTSQKLKLRDFKFEDHKPRDFFQRRFCFTRASYASCSRILTKMKSLQTSSKLRLASSVSSIDFKSSRFSKRHIAFVVLFVFLTTGGGFLLGFFVKGNRSDDIDSKCNSKGPQTNGFEPKNDNIAEIFSQFEQEVSAEQLRENLRQAYRASCYKHLVLFAANTTRNAQDHFPLLFRHRFTQIHSTLLQSSVGLAILNLSSCKY